MRSKATPDAHMLFQQSKKRVSLRDIALILRKKEKKHEYWPRLTKEKIKLPYLKTDFSKV